MESIKASSAPITPSELLRQTQLLLDVFSAFEPETLGKSHTEDGRFNERLACAEQLQTLRTGGRLGGPRTMLSFSDAMTFVYHDASVLLQMIIDRKVGPFSGGPESSSSSSSTDHTMGEQATNSEISPWNILEELVLVSAFAYIAACRNMQKTSSGSNGIGVSGSGSGSSGGEGDGEGDGEGPEPLVSRIPLYEFTNRWKQPLWPKDVLVGLAPYWAIASIILHKLFVTSFSLSPSQSSSTPSPSSPHSEGCSNIDKDGEPSIELLLAVLLQKSSTQRLSVSLIDDIVRKMTFFQTSNNDQSAVYLLYSQLKKALKSRLRSPLSFAVTLSLATHSELSLSEYRRAARKHSLALSQSISISFAQFRQSLLETMRAQEERLCPADLRLVHSLLRAVPEYALMQDNAAHTTPLCLVAAYRGASVRASSSEANAQNQQQPIGSLSHATAGTAGPSLPVYTGSEESHALTDGSFVLALCQLLCTFAPTAVAIADKTGALPVHHAARRGHSAVLRYLCGSPASAHCAPLYDSTHKNALHHALLNFRNHDEDALCLVAAICADSLRSDMAARSGGSASGGASFNLIGFLERNCPASLYLRITLDVLGDRDKARERDTVTSQLQSQQNQGGTGSIAVSAGQTQRSAGSRLGTGTASTQSLSHSQIQFVPRITVPAVVPPVTNNVVTNNGVTNNGVTNLSDTTNTVSSAGISSGSSMRYPSLSHAHSVSSGGVPAVHSNTNSNSFICLEEFYSDILATGTGTTAVNTGSNGALLTSLPSITMAMSGEESGRWSHSQSASHSMPGTLSNADMEFNAATVFAGERETELERDSGRGGETGGGTGENPLSLLVSVAANAAYNSSSSTGRERGSGGGPRVTPRNTHSFSSTVSLSAKTQTAMPTFDQFVVPPEAQHEFSFSLPLPLSLPNTSGMRALSGAEGEGDYGLVSGEGLNCFTSSNEEGVETGNAGERVEDSEGQSQKRMRLDEHIIFH